MGKFTENVSNLNDKLMIAGLLMIFESVVFFSFNFIPTSTGLINPGNLGFFISYITLAAAATIAYIMALFIAIFWSFNKHRPLIEIGAIVSLLSYTLVFSTFEIFLIGNINAEEIYSFIVGLLPYLFLLLDAIKKKQPRLFAVFFILIIITQVVNLVPASSNAFVASQGTLNMRNLVSDFHTLTYLPVYGLYLLAITDRGKTWFDKKHAAVLFLGYGACDAVIFAIEIAIYASIYGGVFRIPFYILPLIRDGLAVFAGIRAWTLCKKDLPDNVLYHVL